MVDKVKYENLTNLMNKLKEEGFFKSLFLKLAGFSYTLKVDSNSEYSNLINSYETLIDGLNSSENIKKQLDDEIKKKEFKENEIRLLTNQITKLEEKEVNREESNIKLSTTLQNARDGFQEDSRQMKEEQLNSLKNHFEKLERRWNNHEIRVIDYLKKYSEKEQLEFFIQGDFPIKGMKPEFSIKSGERFVIFDAKTPKISFTTLSLDNEEERIKEITKKVKDSVKKASEGLEKYAHKDNYPTIYLVAPEEFLEYLDTYSYGFRGSKGKVEVITLQQFGTIIDSILRVENLEELKNIDPEERDNLIWSLGSLTHLSKRKIIADLDYAESHATIIRKSKDLFSKDILKDLEKTERETLYNFPGETKGSRIESKTIDTSINKLKALGVTQGVLETKLKKTKEAKK